MSLVISNFFTFSPPRTDRRISIQKDLMEAFSRYANLVETLIDEDVHNTGGIDNLTHGIVDHLILCRAYTQQGLIELENLELSGSLSITMPPIEAVYDLNPLVAEETEIFHSVVAESLQLANLVYRSISDADCLHYALKNLSAARNLLLRAIGNPVY